MTGVVIDSNLHISALVFGGLPQQLLDALQSEGTSVGRVPDDNHVLECAVSAGAQYLVTGNVRHFPPEYKAIRVVTARGR